jgi:hypothetical protein
MFVAMIEGNMKKIFALYAMLMPFVAGELYAQVSAGGTLPTARFDINQNIPLVQFEALDAVGLLMEDELEEKDVPLRFGLPRETSLSLQNNGLWTSVPDGGRLWQLDILCPGANSINLIFDRFNLPVGAELFVYNEDRSMVIGAFTEFNNKVDLSFATQPVSGELSHIEYFEPAQVSFSGEISISHVIHGYRDIFNIVADRNYGDSGSCNNNVNCPEGDPWTNEIRSAAMILTSGGSRICSGAMINNVRQDLTQYFLTANHCLGGETNWIFMFNYQSAGCNNQNGPTSDSVQGAILRATNSASDFALLELTETIPESYEITYAGWSAIDTPAPNVVGIHHPSGDIKKISFEDQAVSSDRYLGSNGVAGSHWKVTDWDDGTTEGGSSGSPIFDPQHRIVGQLHGGYASCSSQTADWYGKVSMSWDYGAGSSSRLIDWLDPDNTGAQVLNTLDPLHMVDLGLDHIELEDFGDGDGIPEADENFELIIYLENIGPEPVSGAQATLSSPVSWLSITENIVHFPDFDLGEIHPCDTGFGLQFGTDTPISFDIILNLSVFVDGLSIQLALPISGTPRELYYADSFEEGAGEWTHTSPINWEDQWHISTEDSWSGGHAWKCGSEGTSNYQNNLDAILLSPELHVRPWTEMTFIHRMVAEASSAAPDSCYDGGFVEISVDGGSNWDILHPDGGYSHSFKAGSTTTPATHPFAGGTPAWSGEFAWQTAKFDLGSYALQDVLLRFRFGSDNGLNREGWYFDDLEFSAPILGPVAVTDLRIELIPGNQVKLNWTAVSGSSAYRIESSGSSISGWEELGQTIDSEWIESISIGQRYYRVIALD